MWAGWNININKHQVHLIGLGKQKLYYLESSEIIVTKRNFKRPFKVSIFQELLPVPLFTFLKKNTLAITVTVLFCGCLRIILLNPVCEEVDFLFCNFKLTSKNHITKIDYVCHAVR